MRTVNNILDLSTDRDAFGIQNSMDAFKGTSFRFLKSWQPNMHYYNDEYVIDCVTYQGSLWVCTQSHHSDNTSFPAENSSFWYLAVKGGVDGVPGINGADGGVFIPSVENGQLVFTLKENAVNEIGPFNLHADFKVVDVDSSNPYIGWSYDGTTYNKICDVSYLRNSIHIGPTPPDDPSKIWIDTSEDAIGEFNSLDFVYTAFKAAGGEASKDTFNSWLAGLGSSETISDFGEVSF